MPTWRQWGGLLAVVLGLAGGLGRADAGGRTPPKPKLTPVDEEFARLATRLQRQGRSFDEVLAALCQAALHRAEHDPALVAADQARSVFGGLWLWGQAAGAPALQGRSDLALHFIGGGAFQGYWDAGYTAGLIKEQIDERHPDNVFDLDDLAATMLGARWMELATTGDADQTRQWLRRWARGEWTLTRDLPPLRFGRLPTGTEPAPGRLRELKTFIQRSLPPAAAAPAPARAGP